jgi:hypothetical protein
VSQSASQLAQSGVASIASGSNPIGAIVASAVALLGASGVFKGKTQHLSFAQQKPIADTVSPLVVSTLATANWNTSDLNIIQKVASYSLQWITTNFPNGTTWTSYQSDTTSLLYTVVNNPSSYPLSSVVWQVTMYILGNYDASKDQEFDSIFASWSNYVFNQTASDLGLKVVVPVVTKESATSINSAPTTPTTQPFSLSSMFSQSNMNTVYLFAGFIVVLIIITR